MIVPSRQTCVRSTASRPHDAIFFTPSPHGVKFNFFGVPDEFGNDDGVVRRHVRRVAEEGGELAVGRRDLHGRAAEDERGPDEDGILDLGREGLRVLHAL